MEGGERGQAKLSLHEESHRARTWSYSDPNATRLRKYSRVRRTFAAIALGVIVSSTCGFCSVPRF